MNQYVNCHQHGELSLLDGLAKYKPLVDRAVGLGMSALAITEHGNLHGLLDFYDACTKREDPIKPLIGIECYQARKTRFDKDEEERAGRATDELDQRGPYHLTVLARNLVGYKNLIKLSSRSYLEGFYGKPRVDYDLLAQHAEGLTVLSGCLNGAVQQHLLRGDTDGACRAAAQFQDIVGKEHFFIEIQDHGIPEQLQVKDDLVKIAKDLRAPIVPTCDSHYVRREDADIHDTMLCLGTHSLKNQENRFKFHNDEFYLKSYDEMAQRFSGEWLANSLVIAEQVDIKLDFGELHFPAFDIPDGSPAEEYLERQAHKGLKERYGDPLPEKVVERFEHELGVVRRMGFSHYFLVVADLVRWARENSIRVGPGRGSGAGSILSYALRITNLDPLRFGLLFERFLVEGRRAPPDIDLDFDDRYRDRVVEYAKQKYGSDKVANIATFSTIGSKSGIRDVGRVLGYDLAIVDRLSKMVPPPALGVTKTIEESLQSPDMAKAYAEEPEAKIILDAAKGLEGLVRHVGMHAAGVVICKSDITDFVPVMRAAEGGPIVTQWPMERIEEIGLLKIDFLGLRNLGVIDMCLQHIKDRHGIDIDLDDNFALDDPIVYENLQQGKSQGVFQMESRGMTNMMLSLKPSRIEDLMALVSLYRPGPLGSHLDRMYINRKHGKETVRYSHPSLSKALVDTYGVMLYQEDVLSVARILAGFSVGEADDLRKAVGKKQLDKIGLFRTKFVDGCMKTNGVSEERANKIYTEIEYFGGYGFPKAHGASYAIIAYITAWLKARYPAEYMAALLSSVFDDRDKALVYLNECRQLGIEVLPPSLNDSEADFTVADDHHILFGLRSIEGIADFFVNTVLTDKTRYSNIWDFLRRINPEVLNKGIIEHLIYSGSLDELVPLQPHWLLSRGEKMRLMDAERQQLGVYVSQHPLTGVWENFVERKITHTIDQLPSLQVGTQVTVGGMFTKVDRYITRRGDAMCSLVLEDPTGTVSIPVFPKLFAKLPLDYFAEGAIVWMTGKVTKGRNEEEVVQLSFLSKKDVYIPKE